MILGLHLHLPQHGMMDVRCDKVTCFCRGGGWIACAVLCCYPVDIEHGLYGDSVPFICGQAFFDI